MARIENNTEQQFASIKADIQSGKISPFYLLFGKEHYYIDKVCDLLMEKALLPEERDFGQIVLYGADVTTQQIISVARQYPMMASRQLVVVKEAQMIKNIEKLYDYYSVMMPTTILVVCYKTPNDPTSSKNVDKRTLFYKEAASKGVVFESNPIKEDKIPFWIERHTSSLGAKIESDAAALLTEACGSDLSKLALEIDKLFKQFSEGQKQIITSEMVEKNVGVSREYNAFELSKAFSSKDSTKIYRITAVFGQNPRRFPIQMTLGALSGHFIKILKYISASKDTNSRQVLAAAVGVPPFFLDEYQMAARNYPLKKCIKAISLLKDYDYRSKSNTRGSATDGELLLELVSKLLNL